MPADTTGRRSDSNIWTNRKCFFSSYSISGVKHIFLLLYLGGVASARYSGFCVAAEKLYSKTLSRCAPIAYFILKLPDIREFPNGCSAFGHGLTQRSLKTRGTYNPRVIAAVGECSRVLRTDFCPTVVRMPSYCYISFGANEIGQLDANEISTRKVSLRCLRCCTRFQRTDLVPPALNGRDCTPSGNR